MRHGRGVAGPRGGARLPRLTFTAPAASRSAPGSGSGRTRHFAERLDAAHTGYGTPLPPGLRAEVRRTTALLAVVEGQQGIDKAGPPWLRAQMVQLAWRWLRHQPESALSVWFRARAGTSGSRVRRVFVVALARKLLVALWRYATTGVAPDGVALA